MIGSIALPTSHERSSARRSVARAGSPCYGRFVATILLFAFLGGCASSPKPVSERKVIELSTRLDEILHRRDTDELFYGARVIDLATGQELYSIRADDPVIPASNMKLPVSATFLDMFGPEHTFKTYLAIDGDDLWVIGTGDPAVGDPRINEKYGRAVTSVFNDWTTALQSRGISEIKGKLYYYDGALDDQWVHRDWSKSFLTDWYAAPVSGLNFNDNCIDVEVFPSQTGQPAAYIVTPPVTDIQIKNEVITAASGEDPSISREAEADVFTLSGATTQPVELESKPITDPGKFFADALRTHLSGRGIEIAGVTERAARPLGGAPVPPQDKIVATHETRVSDILWRINKNSQNLFAEAACKLAGQRYLIETGRGYRPGSWTTGQQAVKDFLGRQEIDASSLVVADGSGLGRGNRVTARIISDLLVAMHAHRYGQFYRESLSVAGQDGTLRNRMKDIKGHVFAKTGYIRGVRACSGYVKTRDGRWLVFSIIFNGIDGSVTPYEALQDEAIRTLVDWPALNPSTAPATTQPAIAAAR